MTEVRTDHSRPDVYDEVVNGQAWSTLLDELRDPDPPGCGCETWNCTVCRPPWGSAEESTTATRN